MAGQFVPAVQSAISAATTGGQLTVGSTTGMFPSMVGWINNGTVSQKVRVMKVTAATTLLVQKVIDAEGIEAAGTNPLYPDDRLKPARYDYSDVSAFAAGYTLYFDDQFVYATNLSQTF